MILVGSRALQLRAPHLLRRRPVDFDWICSESDFERWLAANQDKVLVRKTYTVLDGTKIIVEGEGVVCEFELIQPGSSSEMFRDIVTSETETLHTMFGMVPCLDMLFSLKKSHRYLKNSPFFWKTVTDYHSLKQAGCTVRPEYVSFLRKRESETYCYKHPSLAQRKETFFTDDKVQYTYDHDSVHRSVAVFDVPAYTRYLKDGHEVMCDKEKFFSIPREMQIAGVVEEACVLAIERSLVPYPGVRTPKDAWFYALSKVCTSITSGWFREFAYENIFDVIRAYPKYYWDKFQADVSAGRIGLVGSI